jgi:hypothetical protein
MGTGHSISFMGSGRGRRCAASSFCGGYDLSWCCSTIALVGRDEWQPQPAAPSYSGASLYLKAVRGVRVSEKIMPTSNIIRFSCPHCAASYHLVHVEAEDTASDGEVACLRCHGPLPCREGRFIRKYLFVDRGRSAVRPVVVQSSHQPVK